MSSCSFTIPFEGSPEAPLARARKAVESQGGVFTGDDTAGEFSVSAFGNSVAGSYTITGQEFQILITDKPFLLPCNMIEGFLRSQLGN